MAAICQTPWGAGGGSQLGTGPGCFPRAASHPKLWMHGWAQWLSLAGAGPWAGPLLRIVSMPCVYWEHGLMSELWNRAKQHARSRSVQLQPAPLLFKVPENPVHEISRPRDSSWCRFGVAAPAARLCIEFWHCPFSATRLPQHWFFQIQIMLTSTLDVEAGNLSPSASL